MAEGADKDQKTEAPTEKRKREAVEKGDVLQSRELGTALVVLAGAGWLALAGPWAVGALEDMLRAALSFDHGAVADFDPGRAILTLLVMVALPLAALFGLTLLAAIGTPAALGSLGFRWGAVAFKGDKLNPLNGVKRIFGLQGLVELGKSLAKVALLGGVGWWLLSHQARGIAGLGGQDIRHAIGEVGGSFVMAVLVMALALVAIAGIDIPAQIIQRGQRLRMTKDEVKREHRESEGSPELKATIRRKQHQMSASGRKAVAEATVVLTNPTHFAVALRYRPGFDAAPVVVAKGRGATADAIRDLARENAVPMLSYPLLARAIYYTSRANQQIRDDLYLAVATIIAFVFNIDRAMVEGIAPPVVEVPAGARFDSEGRATD
ncbi:EscU/YscU/HrcU family type III secretion system export apparatus switch protein [Sphingomonas fennica]|uniref:Flagellar biosynthesis protein FlhB n=1 Tax=Edaphosphingomonas fennica TaxID=114404 RepID=A0A2T4I7J8_9SPHN|nr:flagellar type III secretion system protein FlhB [Sphingomonas fennica]PTD27295.1 flagellar biosynthesis protein FlhB [Sphingomonas fennica]